MKYILIVALLLTSNLFAATTKNADKDIPEKGFCLVEYWMDGCPPCRMLSNVLDGMKDIKTIKIKEPSDYAGTYPTLIFYKDGKAVLVCSGYMPEVLIREKLQELK